MVRTIIYILLILFAGASQAQDKIERNRLYSLALQKERNRAYDQAAVQYEKFFRFQPAKSAYYQGLKRNLLRLEKYQLLQTVIEKRLSVIKDPAASADLGMVFYKRGQVEAAHDQWQHTLDRFSANAMAYIQVASVMMAEGLSGAAIKTYLTGRKKLKDDTAFAVELASIYANRDEKARAAVEYLNYYRKNPRQIRWLESQVISYLNSADSLQVLQAVRTAVDRDSPADINLLKIYAKCMKSLNRKRAALDIIIRIEKIAAGSNRNYHAGAFLNQFAREAFQQGKNELALAAYKELITRWPESRLSNEARYKTARILEEQGNYAAALKQLDNFLITNKGHFAANLLRGSILAKDLHQPEQAVAIFSALFKRVRIRPQQRQLALALGDTYLQLGEYSQSEKWYRQALRKSDSFNLTQKNEVFWAMANAQFIAKKFSLAAASLAKIKPASDVKDRDDLMNDALEMQFLISDNQADSSGALSLYADFKGALARFDYSAAVASLENIEQHHSDSALAPESLLQLAALFALHGEQQKEESALRRFIEGYADSGLLDEVYFKLADLLMQTDRTKKAAVYLDKILTDYPYSTFLEASRLMLRQVAPAVQ